MSKKDKELYEKRKARFAAAIPHEARSWTIPEFCFAENISEPTYYKMRDRGLGPKESRYLGTIRISPEARLEWHRRMQSAKHQRANKIEDQRRRALSRRAGKASGIAMRQKRKRAAVEIAASAE